MVNSFSNGPSLVSRSRSGRGTPGQLRRSSSVQNINGPVSHNDHYGTPNGGNNMIQTTSYNGISKVDRASHGSLHSNASLGNNPQMGNRAMSPMGGNASQRNMSQTQLGAQGEPLMGSPVPVARARALYAYQASADDPNELSFGKGEILDVIDQSGKWVCWSSFQC